MANSPYDGGAGTVTLDPRTPNDYERVNVDPAAFGGAIAHGAQELGQGAVKASQFYSQITTQDIQNRAQTEYDGLLHGVPGRMVQQPDGTMAPDTGFLGKRGVDAANSYAEFQKNADDIHKKYSDMTTTQEQQLEFDKWSQSYKKTYIDRRAGDHYDTQYHTYADGQNDHQILLGLSGIANNAYDDQEFDRRLHDIRDGYVKKAQINGQGSDGEQAAIQKADQTAWKARLDSIYVHNPALAAKMVDEHQKELGEEYEPLAEKYRHRATQAVGVGAANDAIAKARSGAIQPPPPGSAADARVYLQGLSAHQDRPGDTSFLHPEFAQRLAGAIKEARASGLDVSMQSGYRGPNETGSRYDAEGWSLHDKGAAADINGLDGAGGPKTQQWAQIAAKYGLFNPYGIGNAAEFNHWQLVPYKLENRPDVMAAIKGAGGNQAAVWSAIKPAGGVPSNIDDATRQMIDNVSDRRSFKPGVLSSVIEMESGWDTKNNTGIYNGLTQIGRDTFNEAGGRLAGLTYDQYMNAGPAGQIDVYDSWLRHYDFNGKMQRNGIDFANLPANKQAAVLQAFQFGPNDERWMKAAGAGNWDIPVTDTRQAKALGSTSLNDMASYYGGTVNRTSQAGFPDRVRYALAHPGSSPQAAGSANPSLPQVDSAPPLLPAPPPPPQAPQASPQPATPEQIKAAAYQAIHDNPDLSQEAKEYAYREINQQITEQQIMEQAGEKAKHEANEKAANGYVTRILNGNGGAGIIQQIANDPALKWETKEHLVDAVKKHSGSDVEEAKLTYGPGFWKHYKEATAAPGDPSRIADPTKLYQYAGSGGDLTLAGVQKLSQVIQQNQKSVNDQAVNTTKVGLLNYAKDKLSFDQEGLAAGIALKDPKGKAIFEGQFIPKFEAAYDQWVKDGKDPWQFLTQKNVDAMAEGMRPKAQMQMDRMAATGEAAPAEAPNAPLPPAPAGVNPEAWTKVVAVPPMRANGTPFDHKIWSDAVSMLLANPSPEYIKSFNLHFGQSGLDGQKILDEFSGKAVSPEAAKPAPVEPGKSRPATEVAKERGDELNHFMKWLGGGLLPSHLHYEPLTKEDYDRAKLDHLWSEKGLSVEWNDFKNARNKLRSRWEATEEQKAAVRGEK